MIWKLIKDLLYDTLHMFFGKPYDIEVRDNLKEYYRQHGQLPDLHPTKKPLT